MKKTLSSILAIMLVSSGASVTAGFAEKKMNPSFSQANYVTSENLENKFEDLNNRVMRLSAETKAQTQKLEQAGKRNYGAILGLGIVSLVVTILSALMSFDAPNSFVMGFFSQRGAGSGRT
jgi:CHASE3 domain sensor protein